MVELLVAIGLLGILLGIGVPAYRSMVAEQNVRGAAASLHSALLLARSEAIKLNRQVILRPATDEDWSSGWLVETADTTDAAALHRDRILSEVVTVTSAAAEVKFRPSGRLTAAGDLTFELEANRDGDKKRCVTIGLDGRPVTASGGC